MFVFITISAVTVMNMMIGVLVEVVKGAAHVERESMIARMLKDVIVTTWFGKPLDKVDEADLKELLSKQDFLDLLCDAPQIMNVKAIKQIERPDLSPVRAAINTSECDEADGPERASAFQKADGKTELQKGSTFQKVDATPGPENGLRQLL